ncbi:MAG TPA: glycosyltransferase [bacterium]|nr:glycosyltransferase [bacterium]HOL48782.1 glycosyltransferase [bacterium]HPQ19667.1 glycosyltransferase [bacterium]
MKTTTIEYIKKLAEKEITDAEKKKAKEFLQNNKVVVFIVAYNAERHLEQVINRIPEDIAPLFTEILIIDDSSTDATYEIGKKIMSKFPAYKIHTYRTPFNRGYGGNQKLGYLYCIKKNYDYVILLHGDGQYAPEYLPKILSAFDNETDAVFASRMLNKKQALAGGMPLYKWFGNQVLTFIENKLLNLSLSEFHTGYRAYRVNSLKEIPFQYNSNNFHFDTEIIIQAKAANWKIKEISLPAYYGDEICRVDGLKYAINCIKSIFRFYLVRCGIYYKRNYDIGFFEEERFYFKQSPFSLHQFILEEFNDKKDSVIIELGANFGLLSNEIAKRVKEHYAVDNQIPMKAGNSIKLAFDLNTDFSEKINKKFDYCIALDVIHKLVYPRNFLQLIFNLLKIKGKAYISTANIGFLPMRISLLFGQFNYSKRGILDMRHKRLFTIKSLKNLIEQYNYRVDNVIGFPPPLTDMILNNTFFKLCEMILAILARKFPSLFSYNFLIIATRLDSEEDILEKTIQ